MTSDNSMIVGGGDLSVPWKTVHPFLDDDEQAHAVDLEVDQLDRRFRLTSREKPILIVGRSPDCDITLPNPTVSYRHAYLQLVGGQVHCVDLASRTGTFWGSEQRRSGWLLPEQSITIGPYAISHASPHAALPPETLSAINLLTANGRECYQARDVELTFLNSRNGTDGRRSWRLDQPITLLGKSSRCRLRVDHPSVSRVHCSLMVTPDGLWITDLLGKGGTWINGEKIAFRLLKQGDEIAVGEFRLSVNYVDETAESDHRDDVVPEPQRRKNVPQAPPADPAAEFSADFILSLMDRFAAMQQQMSAVSQQQMMFMAQLVGTMHQNHHDVVQQELARINQISEQIQQLRAQAFPGEATAPESPFEATLPPIPTDPISLPQAPAGNHLPHPAPKLTAQPTEMPPPPAPETTAKETTAEDGNGSMPDSDAGDGDVRTSPPVDAENASEIGWPPDTPAAVGDERGSDDARAAETTGRESPRYTPRDVESHTQLIERMAELERERSSRWKKIMRMVTGSGP
ncbi:MAG: FHA domain-containing protein [Planctomycetaceae bacterium]